MAPARQERPGWDGIIEVPEIEAFKEELAAKGTRWGLCLGRVARIFVTVIEPLDRRDTA